MKDELGEPGICLNRMKDEATQVSLGFSSRRENSETL